MKRVQQRSYLLAAGMAAVDPLLLGACFLGAGWARWETLPPSPADWLAILVALPVSAVCLQIAGAYTVMRKPSFTRWCETVIGGALLTVAVIALIAFVTKTGGFMSRSVLLSTFVAWPGLMLALRYVVHREQRAIHESGGAEVVVLAGPAQECFEVARHLDANPWFGLAVVGMACNYIQGSGTNPRRPSADSRDRRLVVRPIDRLEQMIRHLHPDRVILCSVPGDEALMRHALRSLRDHPVVLQFAPNFRGIPIFTFRAEDMAGRPLLDLSASPLSERALLVKWLEDKILGTLFLIMAIPVMLVAAIAVRLSSPGPIVFAQPRHGLGGKVFRVYKFRTMRQDPLPDPPQAEDGDDTTTRRLRAFRATGGELRPTAFIQAREGDPRITAVGAFLRRTSIDELPQLFNVLKGDMSLVGPRPHATGHNRQFADSIQELMRRHYVKPGITGLAQVSGARGRTSSTTAMQRRVDYDLEYITNWSLWLDVRIILMTFVWGILTKEP